MLFGAHLGQAFGLSLYCLLIFLALMVYSSVVEGVVRSKGRESCWFT